MSEKESGLTMADFADCITDEPWYGEEGYKGDDPELLEYPCNCKYCLRAAGIEVEDDSEEPIQGVK